MWLSVFAFAIYAWRPWALATPVDRAPAQRPEIPQGKLSHWLLRQKSGQSDNTAHVLVACNSSELKPDYDPEPYLHGEYVLLFEVFELYLQLSSVWSCVMDVGHDMVIGIEIDFENLLPPVPPTVNEADLLSALADGASAMFEAARHGALVPTIGTGRALADVVIGDAAIHFEGFPCTGEEEILTLRLPIEQPSWKELGYALQGLEALIKTRRAHGKKNNAAVGRVLRGGWDPSSFSDLGPFNIQSTSAPYRKVTDAFRVDYSCYGRPLGPAAGSGNGPINVLDPGFMQNIQAAATPSQSDQGSVAVS